MIKRRKRTILVAGLLFVVIIISLRTIAIRNYTYLTSSCYPNLAARESMDKETRFRVILGEVNEYNEAVQNIQKLNIPQDTEAGCDYDETSYKLYIL